ILAGSNKATINVGVVDDALAEATETVVLDLQPDAGPSYHVDAKKPSATIKIADNEPTVSITKTKDGSEANGATTGKGVFTVTRKGGDLTQPLTVLYTVAGSATAGDDYAALAGSVTIPANQTKATIEVLVN